MMARDIRKRVIHKRISTIIEKHPPKKALKYLSGYLKAYYDDIWVLDKYAKLNYDIGNREVAGKYWFLKDNRTKEEEDCVYSFLQSKGFSYEHIANELVGHFFMSPRYFDSGSKQKLLVLFEIVKTLNGYIPKFMINWYNYFKKEVIVSELEINELKLKILKHHIDFMIRNLQNITNQKYINRELVICNLKTLQGYVTLDEIKFHLKKESLILSKYNKKDFKRLKKILS
ncbi:DUF6584 family protein [Chondrinema litorale]|uniref:DUF6584 family protein n=1 Tax=Chondrinema litorale TaxID=2994555 RepID=UPI002542704C|nr:DUF6584 family protein [Chondrinema litorale]UZR95965.1 hypothetical protein OQ292_09080 [Chondrinema litorale]